MLEQGNEVGRELFDHKTSKLNRDCIVVKTADLRDVDGAHHKYTIEVKAGPELETLEVCEINFQKGALSEAGPNGITEQALIAIVLDRLRGFNNGPFSCRENAMQITKLEEVLMWAEKRASDRAKRGVEGERTA